jgi:phage gp36-like protein
VNYPTVATPADLPLYGASAAAFAPVPLQTQEAELLAATFEIFGYLASRYQNLDTLTAWSTDLTSAVCKVATYNLFCNRGFNPGNGADVNIRMRYEDAISWARAVSRHEVHPMLTLAAPPLTETGGAMFITGLNRSSRRCR